MDLEFRPHFLDSVGFGASLGAPYGFPFCLMFVLLFQTLLPHRLALGRGEGGRSCS